MPAAVTTDALGRAAHSFIMLLWPRSPRTIDQYITWVQQLQASPAQYAPKGPIVMIALGLLFAVLLMLGMTLFILCRCGCNKCGGRKPKAAGYTSLAVKRTSFFLVALNAVILYFGATSITYSGWLVQSLTATVTDVNSTLTNISSLLQSVSNIGDNVSVIVNQQALALENSLVTTPFNVSITDPATLNFTSSLNSMAGNISASQQAVQNAVSLTNGIQASQSACQGAASAIQSSLSALNWIVVDSTNYTLSNSPSSLPLTAAPYPSFGGQPNLTTYAAMLASIPDISGTTSLINGFVYNFSGTLGAVIKQQMQTTLTADPASLVRGPLSSTKSSLTPLITLFQQSQLQVSTAAGTGQQVNSGRDQVTTVQMATLMSAASIGIAAVLLRKRKLLYITAIVMCFWSALIWLEYIVFFTVGLVMDEVCLSKDALLSSSISAGSFSLQPSYIINSCNSGATLLNLTVNSNGNSLFSAVGVDPTVISSLSSGQALEQLVGLTTTFKNNAASQAASNAPSISLNSQANSINALNLTSFNFTPFSGYTSPFNVSGLRQNVTNFGASLSPSTINPSFSKSQETTDLATFNSVCRSANAGWTDYTYTTIVNTYVVGSSVFSPTVVTGDPNSPQNNNIQNAWNVVFPEIKFDYLATQAIASMRTSTIAPILTAIDNFDAQYSTPLNTNLTLVSGNMSIVQTGVNNFTAVPPVLVALQNSTSAAIAAAIPAGVQGAFVVVDQGMQNMASAISTFLNANTQCGPSSQAITATLNDICQLLLPSFGGMWFSLFMLGFFIFATFVAAMKGAKRIGSQKLGRQVHPAAASGTFDSGKGKGKGDDTAKLPLYSSVVDDTQKSVQTGNSFSYPESQDNKKGGMTSP
ncbi:hypothetical protein RI367_002220 [Sorochytrium milnesiophthora]